MNLDLQQHLEERLHSKITQSKRLNGGDISHVYELQTNESKLVIKINKKEYLPMLEAESHALSSLADVSEISVPRPHFTGIYQQEAYLLMDFVEKNNRQNYQYEHGHALAALHALEHEKFGWETDNFIATLVQENPWTINWPEFYAVSRIEPQLRLAKNQRYLNSSEIPAINKIADQAENVFSKINARLTHGDLWSGNYFIDTNHKLCILDPAISYAHPAMDLGMMQLFGKIPAELHQGYLEKSPDLYADKSMIDLAQLYYLLVHLNLFGLSYKSSTLKILQFYFL